MNIYVLVFILLAVFLFVFFSGRYTEDFEQTILELKMKKPEESEDVLSDSTEGVIVEKSKKRRKIFGLWMLIIGTKLFISVIFSAAFVGCMMIIMGAEVKSQNEGLTVYSEGNYYALSYNNESGYGKLYTLKKEVEYDADMHRNVKKYYVEDILIGNFAIGKDDDAYVIIGAEKILLAQEVDLGFDAENIGGNEIGDVVYQEYIR